MKEHRKIAVHVLGFFLLMVLTFVLLSMVVNRVNLSDRRLALHINPTLARIGGQESLMTNDFNPFEPYDVVVLGSSHAYRGYDPRVFSKHGWSIFNAGSSAQHPRISFTILEELVAHSPSKPFIIIDVFDKILEMDGKESSGRMLVNCAQWPLANTILHGQFDVVALNNYCARVFANHSKLELQVSDYAGLGYCSKETVLAAGPEEVKYQFSGNKSTIAELEKCLLWLNQNSFSFVLVSHPMPAQEGFADYHTPAATMLKSLASKYNTVFLDYTQLAGFSNENRFFADATHLNQTGVEFFNNILIDTLLKFNAIDRVH
jgi:hypothetical protein